MIELTPSARQRLDAYLAELRRVLTDCPSVDPADVERDVQDHIDAALSNASGPVDAPHLDQVLRSLGEPHEWAPDRESWFRRPPAQMWHDVQEAARVVTQRLAVGPESFRLPYLSFLVLAISWALVPMVDDNDAIFGGFIGTLAAFVLARAALAIHGPGRPSAAQMWLLAPTLLLVYIPFAIAIVGWPVMVGAVVADEAVLLQRAKLHSAERRVEAHQAAVELLTVELNRIADATSSQALQAAHALQAERVRLNAARADLDEAATQPVQFFHRPVTLGTIAAFTAALTGCWWLLLGLAAWWKPGWLRAMLRPFAERLGGGAGLAFSALGAVVMCIGLTLLSGTFPDIVG